MSNSPLVEGQNVAEIKFILTDREKDNKGEIIGQISIDLRTLMDQKMKQIDDFIINRNGNKTKFKLHFQIKYIYSKVYKFILKFLTIF